MTIIALHKCEIYTDSLYVDDNIGDCDITSFGEKWFQIKKGFGFGISGSRIPQRQFKSFSEKLLTDCEAYFDGTDVSELNFADNLSCKTFQILVVFDIYVLVILKRGVDEPVEVYEYSIYDDIAIGSGQNICYMAFALMKSYKHLGVRKPDFNHLFEQVVKTNLGCGGDVKRYKLI